MSAQVSSARVIAAFLIAPLAPCLALTLAADGLLWFIVFAPFCYVLSAAGIPAYFLFKRMGWLKLWQVVPAGSVLGVAIAFTKALGPPSANNALQLAGYGALTALVFWLVAFAGSRSKNSFKPNPLRGSA